jgi:hypothetical protein
MAPGVRRITFARMRMGVSRGAVRGNGRGGGQELANLLPHMRGDAERPGVAVTGRCTASSYGVEAANTFVRSAVSTPPVSTGLPAVEPWVEVQNGLNAVPTDPRPS